MAKKKILIITHTADNTSIDTVSRYIEAAGGEAIRFNVDRYPLNTRLTTIYLNNNSWQVILEKGGAAYDLTDIAGVWYRRSYHVGKGLSGVIDEEYLSAATQESRRTLFGMLEGLPCFQMEHYSVYRRLDSKEEQLRMAARHGFKIPLTCISNSPVEVNKFIQRLDSPVITKMQSAFAVYREDREQVVFTNEVTATHLKELEDIRFCPMMFQQKIEKKLELRVTIVGQEIFAFSIDSQKKANARVDWRKEGAALLHEWQPYTLPPQLQNQLLSFMDSYQLNYGAIDLILTPDDQYYFLEVNPAGEYFWLDQLCDNAISQQIAAVLLGEASRRQQAGA